MGWLVLSVGFHLKAGFVKRRLYPVLAVFLAGCLDMSASMPGQEPGQVTTLLNMECSGARPRNITPGALWLPSDSVAEDSVVLDLQRTSPTESPRCVLRTETLPFPEAPAIVAVKRLSDTLYSVVMTGQHPGRVQITVGFNQSRVFSTDVLTASRSFAAAAWGHVGAGARTPENTLLAVRTAIRAGLVGSEIDVRLTRDTVPVVIHDETVDRTTRGTGAVASLTAAEITALDAGSNFGAEFAGEPVPLLSTVLDEVVQHGHRMMLDVKSQNLVSLDEWARLIVQTVRASGAESLVTILVSSPAFLRAARAASPTIRLAFAAPYYRPSDTTLARDLELDVMLYLQPEALLEPEAIAGTTALRGAGIQVMASTTNRPTLADSILTRTPVTGILTDYPPRVYQLRGIIRAP